MDDCCVQLLIIMDGFQGCSCTPICLSLDDHNWSSDCGGVPSIGLPMLWLRLLSFMMFNSYGDIIVYPFLTPCPTLNQSHFFPWTLTNVFCFHRVTLYTAFIRVPFIPYVLNTFYSNSLSTLSYALFLNLHKPSASSSSFQWSSLLTVWQRTAVQTAPSFPKYLLLFQHFPFSDCPNPLLQRTSIYITLPGMLSRLMPW